MTLGRDVCDIKESCIRDTGHTEYGGVNVDRTKIFGHYFWALQMSFAPIGTFVL
jgi:hypothetical protein